MSFPGEASTSAIGGFDLNKSGEVLFKASVDGTFNGIFLYRGGAISTIVLEGQPSPDGSLFQSIQFPAWLTDAGEVLFKAQSLTGFLGLYKHDSSTGPLSTIVSQVTVFPAAVLPFPNSDNLLGEFEIPWINKKGDMLIRKQLSPLAIHYLNGKLYFLPAAAIGPGGILTESGYILQHLGNRVLLDDRETTTSKYSSF